MKAAGLPRRARVSRMLSADSAVPRWNGVRSPDNSGGLFGCRPLLRVENVARSIEYYIGSLGFRLGWAWSDEQRFLQRGTLYME
jgi:hypothetical protein